MPPPLIVNIRFLECSTQDFSWSLLCCNFSANYFLVDFWKKKFTTHPVQPVRHYWLVSSGLTASSFVRLICSLVSCFVSFFLPANYCKPAFVPIRRTTSSGWRVIHGAPKCTRWRSRNLPQSTRSRCCHIVPISMVSSCVILFLFIF